jgi:hypothetical protein
VATPVGPPSSTIDSRIQIVWPHGNAPVAQAQRANVSAYLFQSGSTRPAACDPGVAARLWMARNNESIRPVATATRRLESVESHQIAALDFNDIDVAWSRDPRNKLSFWVTLDERTVAPAIWVHGADARTNSPLPEQPTGIGPITAVDARIQILWPHANASVRDAKLANLSATLFQRGTLQTGDDRFNPTVRLYRASNNEPSRPIAVGTRRVVTSGTLSYPVWEFNDIDVSGANDPGTTLYFWVAPDGLDSQPNIWSHGADARTNFPRKTVPAESCR